MPAKKVEEKETATRKGTKPVEKKETKTTAKPKTTKKTEPKAEKTVKKTTKTKQTVKKTETLKKDAAPVEADKKVEVKTAGKTTAKKTTTKKKTPIKKTATRKTTVKKTDTAQKKEQYNQFSLDTCIDMARAMGIQMGYDEYAQMLMDQTDLKAMAQDILDRYHVTETSFNYEEDGYDADLLEVLMEKVAATVDIKASDFAQMGKEIQSHEAYQISKESLDNNDEYNADFDLVRRLLMIAQRKDIHTMKDLQNVVHADATKFIEKFMDVAYAVLRNWQYDDVKYYENFIYAVLSQFTDLYQSLENRAMMDVADLYIEHGDYGLGDANYGYILRENQIKDYIYYRFASAYQNIDRDKCRAIARDALQYVDSRFTYYNAIQQLLEN